MLVTLQQASDHLRRDTTDDNSDLTLKIKAASGAIKNYLKDSDLLYEYSLDSAGEKVFVLDSAGDKIVRDEVKSAVLILIGNLYIDRDGDAYTKGDYSERLGNESLPKTIHWLLDPIRKPTLA